MQVQIRNPYGGFVVHSSHSFNNRSSIPLGVTCGTQTVGGLNDKAVARFGGGQVPFCIFHFEDQHSISFQHREGFGRIIVHPYAPRRAPDDVAFRGEQAF